MQLFIPVVRGLDQKPERIIVRASVLRHDHPTGGINNRSAFHRCGQVLDVMLHRQMFYCQLQNVRAFGQSFINYSEEGGVEVLRFAGKERKNSLGPAWKLHRCTQNRVIAGITAHLRHSGPPGTGQKIDFNDGNTPQESLTARPGTGLLLKPAHNFGLDTARTVNHRPLRLTQKDDTVHRRTGIRANCLRYRRGEPVHKLPVAA